MKVIFDTHGTHLHEGERSEPVALALAVGGVGGDEVAALTCPIMFNNILKRNNLMDSFLTSLAKLHVICGSELFKVLLQCHFANFYSFFVS